MHASNACPYSWRARPPLLRFPRITVSPILAILRHTISCSVYCTASSCPTSFIYDEPCRRASTSIYQHMCSSHRVLSCTYWLHRYHRIGYVVPSTYNDDPFITVSLQYPFHSYCMVDNTAVDPRTRRTTSHGLPSSLVSGPLCLVTACLVNVFVTAVDVMEWWACRMEVPAVSIICTVWECVT